MDNFLKAAALVLVVLILCLNVARQNKEISVLLILAASSILFCFAASSYIQPILEFMEQMQALGKLDTQLTRILLQATGVGLVSEIVNLICSDAGYAALGKTLKIISVCVILWLSLPLLSSLLELIDSILLTL